MGDVLGQLMAPAVGILLSPLPIVGVILMLLSQRAKQNGPAFLIGWIVGMAALVTIVVLVADPADLTDADSAPSTLSGIINLVLALLLWFLAFQQWQKRPADGATPEMPKWMAGIDSMTPLVALGFGAFLSSLNPKNLIMNIAAGTAIAGAELSSGQIVVAMLVFIIIASLAIGGAVIWFLLAGESANATLDKMRGFLVQYNAVIMAVLFLVLGFSMMGKAIPAFIS